MTFSCPRTAFSRLNSTSRISPEPTGLSDAISSGVEAVVVASFELEESTKLFEVETDGASTSVALVDEGVETVVAVGLVLGVLVSGATATALELAGVGAGGLNETVAAGSAAGVAIGEGVTGVAGGAAEVTAVVAGAVATVVAADGAGAAAALVGVAAATVAVAAPVAAFVADVLA